MEIFEVRGERERYRDLLLFADPSWEMVMRYLPHGFMLAAREGDAVLGEIVTVPAAGGWEIKNLAVAEPFHRRAGARGDRAAAGRRRGVGRHGRFPLLGRVLRVLRI